MYKISNNTSATVAYSGNDCCKIAIFVFPFVQLTCAHMDLVVFINALTHIAYTILPVLAGATEFIMYARTCMTVHLRSTLRLMSGSC